MSLTLLIFISTCESVSSFVDVDACKHGSVMDVSSFAFLLQSSFCNTFDTFRFKLSLVLLYRRTAVLLCPVCSWMSCSSIPFSNKREATVARNEWHVKLPTKPAASVSFFNNFSIAWIPRGRLAYHSTLPGCLRREVTSIAAVVLFLLD